MLDHLISELDSRFDVNSSQIVVQLLPSKIANHPGPPHLDTNKFTNLLKSYEDDLPSSTGFDCELDLWEHKWRSENLLLANSLNTPEKVIEHIDQDVCCITLWELFQSLVVKARDHLAC